MLENVICGAIVMLSVWGVLGLVYTLLMRLARPRRGAGAVVALVLGCGPDEAVLRVSYALARLSVSGDLCHAEIAAVCNSGDGETRRAVASAFAQEPRVVICSREDFIARYLDKEPLIGQRNG